ncbi:MAG: hypothetical protein J5U17_03015 [Candidatus Methanoperedens sp.]|nr:hypothetical protein [Candidatus Methanoperedens sp.]MCE8427170.1 hypothetical protein [Candidatus Methanoperedens sp.]
MNPTIPKLDPIAVLPLPPPGEENGYAIANGDNDVEVPVIILLVVSIDNVTSTQSLPSQ